MPADITEKYSNAELANMRFVYGKVHYSGKNDFGLSGKTPLWHISSRTSIRSIGCDISVSRSNVRRTFYMKYLYPYHLQWALSLQPEPLAHGICTLVYFDQCKETSVIIVTTQRHFWNSFNPLTSSVKRKNTTQNFRYEFQKLVVGEKKIHQFLTLYGARKLQFFLCWNPTRI